MYYHTAISKPLPQIPIDGERATERIESNYRLASSMYNLNGQSVALAKEYFKIKIWIAPLNPVDVIIGKIVHGVLLNPIDNIAL